MAAGPPADPLHIVGGEQAQACEWPSVVSILEADETPVMCTGTLIHPNIVSTAAHCITQERPVVAVGFGEEGQGDTGPARTVTVTECVSHPQYWMLGYPDIAYCVLSQPVTDVPIVPLLAGCETDLLVVGSEVTIVGYGADYGAHVDGEVESTGVGPKRYITQTLDDVDPDLDEVHMVGNTGSQSACFGDSGGPAFVQLADGSWRVFGAASRLYDPGGFPPPKLDGNVCGIGVTYGFLSTQQAWLEGETGRDLTPCHDADGSWAPSPSCGAFPTSPGAGFGSWKNGCAGGPVAGGEPVCEDVVGETDSSSSGSSGGDDGSSSGPGTDATTGPGTGPDSTTAPGTSGPTSTSGPTTATGATTGSSTIGSETATTGTLPTDDDSEGTETGGGETGAGAEGDDAPSRGCSCTSGPTSSPFGGGLLLLGLLSLSRRSSRRRRRRPSR